MTALGEVAQGARTWRHVHAALVPHNQSEDSNAAGFLFEEFAKYFFETGAEAGEFRRVWRDTEVPRNVRNALTLADRDYGADWSLRIAKAATT
ncbi:MAG: hypothetical protein AAF500_16440 [Myxococcota bacterium]